MKLKAIKTLQKGTDSFRELATLYFGAVLIGALLFSFFEKVDIITSMWWGFITALTIGYGDVYAHTVGGRVVTVLLSHVVILLIIPLIIGRAVTQLIPDKNEFTHEEQEEILSYIRAQKK
jgi:voltage-gated potassium channel